MLRSKGCVTKPEVRCEQVRASAEKERECVPSALERAFVVRLLIVPSVMHLAGDKAWWLPRWLDRLLPNVDIEGAALERRHYQYAATVDEVAPTPTPEPAPKQSTH